MISEIGYLVVYCPSQFPNGEHLQAATFQLHLTPIAVSDCAREAGILALEYKLTASFRDNTYLWVAPLLEFSDADSSKGTLVEFSLSSALANFWTTSPSSLKENYYTTLPPDFIMSLIELLISGEMVDSEPDICTCCRSGDRDWELLDYSENSSEHRQFGSFNSLWRNKRIRDIILIILYTH